MREVVLAQHMRVLVKMIVQLGHNLAKPVGKIRKLDTALGRHGKSQDYAGECSVNTRFEHAEPQQQTQNNVGRKPKMTRAVEHNQKHCYQHSGGQPQQIGALAIEDGNGENRDKVVGDSQRGEEHANAVGHAIAQKRHNAQRERDVGRHRNCPTMNCPTFV